MAGTDEQVGDKIDKQSLWGDFRHAMKAQHKLAMKASHKALDIPEDMEINASRTGIQAGGIAAIVAAAGIGPAILIGFLLFRPPAAEIVKPVAEVIDNTRDLDLDVKSRYVPPDVGFTDNELSSPNSASRW